MPTLVVCSNVVAAVAGKVVRTNGAVTGINPAPKALHLSHQITVPLLVDGHVSKDVGSENPGRR
jgi:hypothetical protein